MSLPAIDAKVFLTPKGTPYLQEPGVVLISVPEVDLSGMRTFLSGFDSTLQFDKYLDDPVILPPPERLAKVAGQICYASFGPNRTWNSEADKYLRNIKSSGHGSVLEHIVLVVLLYGTSRSLSHELVRHRAGAGFSQASQRYISGKVLRFVERPEYRDDPELHQMFLERIDTAAAAYARLSEMLLERQKSGKTILSAEARTDLRKKVQQCSRSLLPNETEAPLVMSANIRAWRHIIEMRANQHAEIEIRELAYRIYKILRQAAPLLFDDYEEKELPDGTHAVETPYLKV